MTSARSPAPTTTPWSERRLPPGRPPAGPGRVRGRGCRAAHPRAPDPDRPGDPARPGRPADHRGGDRCGRRSPGRAGAASGPDRGRRERRGHGRLDGLASPPARESSSSAHARHWATRPGRSPRLRRSRTSCRPRSWPRSRWESRTWWSIPSAGAYRIDVFDRDRLGLFGDTAGLLAAYGFIVRTARVRTQEGIAANQWQVDSPGGDAPDAVAIARGLSSLARRGSPAVARAGAPPHRHGRPGRARPARGPAPWSCRTPRRTRR